MRNIARALPICRPRRLTAVVLSALTLAVTACGAAPAEPVVDPCRDTRVGGPLAVVILVDRSRGAVNAARDFASADVAPLIDAAKCRGGEIAVGTLRDFSDRPLARVALQPPPPPPVLEEPSGTYVERTRARNEARAVEDAYRASFQTWRDDADQRVAAFRTALEELLSEPGTVNLDVWGGLRRASLFACEGGVNRQATLVTVSSAQDSVGRQPPFIAFDCFGTIAIVNSPGLLGVLGARAPRQFDAVAPAIRFVLDGGVR